MTVSQKEGRPGQNSQFLRFLNLSVFIHAAAPYMRVDVRQTMKQKVVDALGHARGQRSTEVESEKKTVGTF